MKYLFDNNISPRLPRMLCALGVNAVALRDDYPENISDVDLFDKLKGIDVTLISLDRKQLTRAQESVALARSGISALYFGPFFNKLGSWQQAIWVVRRWEGIDGFARKLKPGTVGEMKQNGTIMILQA